MLKKCKIVSQLEEQYNTSFCNLRDFIVSNDIDKESLKWYYLKYNDFIIPKNAEIVNDVFIDLFQDRSVSKKTINLLEQIRSFQAVNDSFINSVIDFANDSSCDVVLLNSFLQYIFESKQINNNLKLEFARLFSDPITDLLELIPNKTPDIINLINILNL